MTTRLIGAVLLFFAAEIGASWWIWARAPADSLGVWYPGFWSFEAGRIQLWVLVLACLGVLWLVASHFLRRKDTRAVQHGDKVCHLTACLVGPVLALGVEGLTSVFYWRTNQATDLRGLYQSIWSWHRVPLASDMGWPSLRIYLFAHLVPWAVFLIAGFTVWYFLDKKWSAPQN